MEQLLSSVTELGKCPGAQSMSVPYLYRKWPGAPLSGTEKRLLWAGPVSTSPGWRTAMRWHRGPSWWAGGLGLCACLLTRSSSSCHVGKVPETQRRTPGWKQARFSGGGLLVMPCYHYFKKNVCLSELWELRQADFFLAYLSGTYECMCLNKDLFSQ